MAIALRSAQGSNNGTGGGTITMTVPTGVQDGDVMVMMITDNAGSSVTWTDPSGWTPLKKSGTASLGSTASYWRLASSEPASYSVTATSGKMAGVIIALSGADSSAPGASQIAAQSNTSSSTITAPALGTFSARNGIDLFLGGIYTGTTTGQPTNYTEPTNGSATSGGGGAAGSKATTGIAYRALTNVTTVGSLSATYGASAANAGHHVFIFEVANETITADKWHPEINKPIFEILGVVSYFINLIKSCPLLL